MSKVIASLPGVLVKNSVVGAILALACYVALQFVAALLIHSEVVGEEMMYPMVCVAAGVSALAGCSYSVLRGGVGSVLSASSVVMVFLTVTVAVALLAGEAGTVGVGFTGVGSAMALGGLVAAVLPGFWVKRGSGRRDGMKGRRMKK